MTSPGRGGSGGASYAVSPPAITPPKGDGVIAGIRETFTADPATGTGSRQLPVIARKTEPGGSRTMSGDAVVPVALNPSRSAGAG